MNYVFFYVEANIFCILILLIILYRSRRGIDKQLKQNAFNKFVLSNILYFLSDIFWVLIQQSIIPKTRLSVSIVNMTNFLILYCLTYYWFYYVEVSEGEDYILDSKNVFITQLPGSICLVLLSYFFIFRPEVVLDENLNVTNIYSYLFILPSIIYILLSSFKSFKKAFDKDNYAYKGQYIMYGILPLSVLFFGILQTMFLNAPLFCFGVTIIMVYVYIASLDDLVSLDPLTGLNNRAQLRRYLTQLPHHLNNDNDVIYLIMMDIDKFKNINDVYGHAEGDKAIIETSDAIKKACSNNELRPFIARYGGDEFLIILKTANVNDVIKLEDDIREALKYEKEINNSNYNLEVSIGYSIFSGEYADFLKAVNEADKYLYEEKRKHHEQNYSV